MHLRHRIDRKFGQMIADGFEVVFRRKALGQQPGNERVDDRLALLRRHIGPDREGAMLAVDDIVVDQTVQIRGEHMIDAGRDIDVEAVLVPDLGTGLYTSDGLPEARGIRPPILQTIEQDVLDLVEGREGSAILRWRGPFGETVEAQAARSRRRLRVDTRQPPEIPPCSEQRGAALREGVAKVGTERIERLHVRQMETGTLHFKGGRVFFSPAVRA